MEYTTFALPSGLRVIHLPSASPVVYCGYAIDAGTRDELPGQEGMAHFCEHTTFKGTGRRRAWHILNCLESVGGDLNAFTTKEDTVFYAATLRDHAARAVDLLTDIVFHSRYPQQELDKEKEVICDEIESYNDSPSELIYDEFEGLLFGSHPLGRAILGRAERLRAFSTADALAFARSHYRPERAVFFAYGDVSPARLERMLLKATADLPPASPATGRRAEPLPTYAPREVRSDRATHQAHAMAGARAYAASDPRRLALYLLNNILGGPGMNARLNIALRERNGLVYTVESSMASYSDTGSWCVYFGCDPHDVARCRRLVARELDRVVQAPLTAAQLAAAKKQIRGQIAVACDSRESFALDFGKSFLHYGHEKDPAELMARIDAITADDLLQVARETFAPGRLTTLTYSPGR